MRLTALSCAAFAGFFVYEATAMLATEPDSHYMQALAAVAFLAAGFFLRAAWVRRPGGRR